MTTSVKWGVVIVNYNSAQFALDAALSVLGDTDAKVIIVDNASTNNSVEIFKTALSDRVHKEYTPSNPIDNLELKFADFASINASLFEEGQKPEMLPSLSIIRACENRGFAAGCNIGLAFLEESANCTHYLMLNPDALVGAGAFAAFEHALSAPDAGLCGATILLANEPGRVQAFGGAKLNSLTLMGENIGQGDLLFSAPSKVDTEDKLTYPLGAAIALKADYLEAAGYMDERYFLYYEEADWVFAGKKYGRTVWAHDAFVFHHYGVSSGSDFRAADQPSRRSPLADYHMARSRFLFALKWRPWLAPLILMIGGGQILLRLMRGELKSALALGRGAMPGAARLYRS